ncbi:MAG TPA: lysine--tRNA ligase [Verrucomicrobiae bacterium]|nr:lysine--tRNA ligase [Verrucomicrobiae bacterium]
MEDTNSLIEQRRAKLKSLEAKGIFPFQNKFTPDTKCNDARSGFESGALPEGTRVAVAGRITAHREMGKSIFVDVRDQSGRIQVYAQKNALGDDQFSIFTHLDLGDFIGVTGTLFRTKTGEPSLKLESFTIVAKSLRPPPAKWHGLEDTEIRYRQRYLDLIANPEVKSVFLKRSAIVHEIRAFFHQRGYVEVETPAMQAIPGGAAAQPFKTKHNALGCDFYLRIALELYHKRLLVGGIDKLFEIGKNFRNEGLSRRHNPEFTMLEAYQAFGDYETMMETVESLITTVAQKVVGTLVIEHNQDAPVKAAIQHALQELDAISTTMTGTLLKATDGNTAAGFVKNIGDARTALVAAQDEIGKKPSHEVAKAAITAILTAIGTIGLHKVNLATGDKSIEDILASAAVRFDGTVATLEKLSAPKVINLTGPWKRAKYKDLIREKTGADWFDVSAEARRQRAHDMGAEIGKEFEDFEVTNAVFSKFIEPTLINPTFVTHLPKELVPLAKLSPEDPSSVEVFECCINGQEISPGYTEQNDPIQQRNTLEHQAGGEQQKLDEDFLVALEHGMPPAGGIGIGIDRLCMMLLGQESIRDVILFPQLKPK